MYSYSNERCTMIRKVFKKLIIFVITLSFCCNLGICLCVYGSEQDIDPNMDEYEPFYQEEIEELEEDLKAFKKEAIIYLDQQEEEKRLEFKKSSNYSVWVHQYRRNVHGQAYTFEKLLRKLNQIDPNFANESVKDIDIYDGEENGDYIGSCMSIENIRNLYERILELLPDKSHPGFLYFFAALKDRKSVV